MSDLTVLVDAMKTTGARAYPIGGAVAGYPYAVLALDGGAPGVLRGGGDSPRTPRRLTVHIHSQSADGLLDYAARADTAFRAKRHAVGTTYREDFSAPMTRDPDDNGVVSLLLTYKLLED